MVLLAVLPTAPPAMSIVYVLTNPGMPGLVKIGRTYGGEDAVTRRTQLYTTGVPFPFTLEFACRVANPEEVEQALHVAFAPSRVNPKREFFKIDPAQAIAILKLLHVEDVTTAVQAPADEAGLPDVAAGVQYAATRRPHFNFEEMGIPKGSVLQFVNGGAPATVAGPKKVLLENEEMSLTAATKQLMNLAYNVAPGPYWTFQGRRLQDIYNETYEEV